MNETQPTPEATATETVVVSEAPVVETQPAPAPIIPEPQREPKLAAPVDVVKTGTKQAELLANFEKAFKATPAHTDASRAVLVDLLKKATVYLIEHPDIENLVIFYDFFLKNRGLMIDASVIYGINDSISAGTRRQMSVLYTAINMTIDYKKNLSRVKPNLDIVRETLHREEIVSFLATRIE
jgi:hypothetical protein